MQPTPNTLAEFDAAIATKLPPLAFRTVHLTVWGESVTVELIGNSIATITDADGRVDQYAAGNHDYVGHIVTALARRGGHD